MNGKLEWKVIRFLPEKKSESGVSFLTQLGSALLCSALGDGREVAFFLPFSC